MTDIPRRIQLSRRKGYRKPENAIVVARPSRWGNPFLVTSKTREAHQRAVDDFVLHFWSTDGMAQRARDELRGHDLACWCPLDRPCHGDFLLKLCAMPAGGPVSE